MSPEFSHVYGKVSRKSVEHLYGKQRCRELAQMFGPRFFAKRDTGIPLDILAHGFMSEERGGSGLNRNDVDVDAFAETVFMPHDEFENRIKSTLGRQAFWHAALPAPKVQVKGDEIFNAQNPFPAKMSEKRNAIIRWLENKGWLKSFKNKDKGWDIEVNKRSIRNTSSHGMGETKAQVFAALPKLISNAVYVDKGNAKKEGHKRHIFAVKTRIADKDYVVGIVVDEDANGKRFYNHELTEIERLGSPLQHGAPESAITGRGENQALSVLQIIRRKLAVKPSLLDKGSLFQTAPAPDSQAFKEWFGDSKVVDEKGAPLVVYHGTNAAVGDDFAFDHKFIGAHGSSEGYGFYFTTDENVAQGYQQNGGSLVKAYLAMQKPMPLKQKPFSKAVLKKILKRTVENEIAENPEEIPGYQESFLSNYANTYEMSLEGALNEAVNKIYEGSATALNQIADIANVSGNKKATLEAVRHVTGYDGVLADGYGGHGKEGGTIYVAWFPEQVKAVENKGSWNSLDPRIFYQTAYHGSPHKFDKFSTDYIGTGEGAQVHGWGLYFEADREVGEEYRRGLSKDRKGLYLNGKELSTYDAMKIEAYFPGLISAITKWRIERAKQIYLEAKNAARERYEQVAHLKGATPGMAKDALDYIESIDVDALEYKESKGQLFKVEIPDDDVLLDEQKPLSEQPEKVKEAIGNFLMTELDEEYERTGAYYIIDMCAPTEEDAQKFNNESRKSSDKTEWLNLARDFIFANATGKKLYELMTEICGSDRAASLALNDMGVKGITYDGRRDGRCYVVFDDKAVKVLETFYQAKEYEEGGGLESEVAQWKARVDEIAASGKAPRRSVKMLSQTPLIMRLLDTAKGAKVSADGGIVAPPHFFDSKHPNITPEIRKQIPESLVDPIAVFDSDSAEGRERGDLVFMLEVKDENGATVVVPVALNATNKEGARLNIAKSAYAKENNGKPSNDWFVVQANKNARYINGQKWERWSIGAGPNCPLVTTNAHGKTVFTENDFVKLRETNPQNFYSSSGSANGAARGGIRTLDDGRALVGLFQSRNASTVLHESAHFWLTQLREAMRLGTAPEWVGEAWAKLEKAYGFSGIELDPYAWREVQERFARDFEAYAREGKAPSWELQKAFDRFRNWLSEIYRSIKSLLGIHELSPDVREVFDALLATEDEIAKSRRAVESAPVMEAQETLAAMGAEIAPELLDKYQQAVEKARANASAVIANRRLVARRAAMRGGDVTTNWDKIQGNTLTMSQPSGKTASVKI